MKRILALLLCVSIFAAVLPAMETDQYNLPPEPLTDIAPEVEAYVTQNIQSAIDGLNSEIAKHEACIANRTRGCLSTEKEQTKLADLRSKDALAKAVFEKLGAGNVFVTKTGTWLNSHPFEHEPSRYKAPYSESIYFVRPVNYATLSPTIKMYGVEFGTDKLDHLFQQGWKYYTTWEKEKAKGRADADAVHKAVLWGRSTENLFFGYVVSGVFSNADLFANYAGMRFYQRLTADVKVGDTAYPAIAKLVDGHWQLTSSNDALKPLITDHLNEALNASNYLPLLYPLIKGVVKKRACPEWRSAFPNETRDELNSRSASLQTWNGEDYGYKRTSRQVHIGDVCFGDDTKGPTA